MNDTKVILIDNANSLLPFDGLCMEPHALAKEIYTNYSQRTIFIINANYFCDGTLRVKNSGIELLKYLRLHNFKQHCILFSFLNREQLMMQSPKNLIVFSEGVTFIRLPYDLRKLDFEILAKITAPEDLSAFFKAESIIPDDRHFFAQWWGVLQLWKVQKALDNTSGISVDTQIDNSFSDSQNELNTYNGLLARYLYQNKVADLEMKLKELEQNRIEKFGRKKYDIEVIEVAYRNKIAEKEAIVKKLEVLKTAHPEDESFTMFQTVLSQLKQVSHSIAEKVTLLESVVKEKILQLTIDQENAEHDFHLLKEYIELEDEKTQEILCIEEKKRNLDLELIKMINELESLRSYSSVNFSIDEVRRHLKEKNPKIIFVDDQADDGWKYIFQQMIYGGLSDAFSVISPQRNESIDDISTFILNTSKELNPDLVILDLRLKGEFGSISNVAEISGIQVLKKLREEKIICPVLISTASNKSWSHSETLGAGAFAYWTKEGLDDKFSLNKTVENYKHLLDLVWFLTLSPEILFLNDIKRGILNIEVANSDYWWEKTGWCQPSCVFIPQPVKKNDIVRILWQAYDLFEDFLRMRLFANKTSVIANHYPSLIIIKLAAILETIHQYASNSLYMTLGQRMEDQLGRAYNKKWSELLKIRNDAVHTQALSSHHLRAFIDALFKYLGDFKDTLTFIQEKPKDDTIISINSEQQNQKNTNPVDGAIYKSRVTSVTERNNTKIYNIENPNLDLVGGLRFIQCIVDRTHNPEIIDKKVDKNYKVEFKLKIFKVSGTTKYFANDTKLIRN